MDHFITETYFNWLKSEAFTRQTEAREYEGVLRLLHDIPFMWIIHSDDNRAGDAMTFRQYEFLDQIPKTHDLDPIKLGQWATASPSVLEVLLGCARRWQYFYGGYSVAYYFGHMFRNMGFNEVPGRVLNPMQVANVTTRVEDWLTRQFLANGIGSPWPLNQGFNRTEDQRQVDMWGQMNAYSAEHFQ